MHLDVPVETSSRLSWRWLDSVETGRGLDLTGKLHGVRLLLSGARLVAVVLRSAGEPTDPA